LLYYIIMEESNECQELKNLKYKTLLLNGVPLKEIKSSSSNDLSNLDKFLENEKNNNVNEPWCKLNKTIKTKKIQEYVEIYKEQNNLNDEEGRNLFSFLKDCIDRKKLQRVKDVIYDKDTGNIKEIPSLCYVKSSKHFTLKNIDKRVSTLKSLAPKKGQGTIRKKEVSKEDSDSEEDDEN
jgi:hypothetical protein